MRDNPLLQGAELTISPKFNFSLEDRPLYENLLISLRDTSILCRDLEAFMDTAKRELDPIKIQTIRDCLDKQFLGVKFSQTIRPTFTFHNGVPKLPWLLVINAEFLADRMSIEELKRFMEEKVLKKIQENPGKRIQISKLRDITVEERNVS